MYGKNEIESNFSNTGFPGQEALFTSTPEFCFALSQSLIPSSPGATKSAPSS